MYRRIGEFGRKGAKDRVDPSTVKVIDDMFRRDGHECRVVISYAGYSEDLFAHGSITTALSSEANALAPELRQIGNGFSGRIKKPKNLVVEAS